MTERDQLKIINAGFTLIRRQPQHFIAYKNVVNPSWTVLEGPFCGIAAREKRMCELVKERKIIELSCDARPVFETGVKQL